MYRLLDSFPKLAARRPAPHHWYHSRFYTLPSQPVSCFFGRYISASASAARPLSVPCPRLRPRSLLRYLDVPLGTVPRSPLPVVIASGVPCPLPILTWSSMPLCSSQMMTAMTPATKTMKRNQKSQQT